MSTREENRARHAARVAQDLIDVVKARCEDADDFIPTLRQTLSDMPRGRAARTIDATLRFIHWTLRAETAGDILPWAFGLSIVAEDLVRRAPASQTSWDRWARALLALGKVSDELGEPKLAAQARSRALDIYKALVEDETSQYYGAMIEARMSYFMALDAEGDLDGALAHFEILRADLEGGSAQQRKTLALARSNVAAACMKHGRYNEGKAALQVAIEELKVLIEEGHDERHTLVAAYHNLGVAQMDEGDSASAVLTLRAALPLYDALIEAGARDLIAEAAEARGRLAQAVGNSNDLTLAAREFVTDSDQRGHAPDVNRLTAAETAHLQFERGQLLRDAGDSDQAKLMFQQALTTYERWIAAGARRYREAAADCHAQLGVLFAEDRSQAAVHFTAAVQLYRTLVSEGIEQCRWPLLRVQLNSGILLSQAGQANAALEMFRSARVACSELRESGQVQRIPGELRALHLEIYERLALRERDATASDEQGLLTTLAEGQALLNVLQVLAAGGLSDGVVWDGLQQVHRLCLLASVDEADRYAAAPWYEAFREFIDTSSSLWLAIARRLIGDAHPNFLHRHGADIYGYLLSALVWWAQRRQKGAGRPLTEWFVYTQGLRAQRDLLHGSSAPELSELREVWGAIDALDRSVAESADDATCQHRLSLVAQRDALRAQLTAAGQLPDAGWLSASELANLLRPHEELWMLYPAPRVSGGTVLVCAAIWCDPADDRLVERVFLVDVPAEETAASWSQQLSVLHQFSDGRSGPWRGTAHWASAVNARAEATASTAPDPWQQLWNVTEWLVAPIQQARARDPALRSVHLIPFGDAHALPWTNGLRDALSRQAIELTVRQYPSLAAWMAARAQAMSSEVTSVRAAIVSDDAKGWVFPEGGSAYLPLVSFEARWSERLWMRSSASPVCVSTADEAAPIWPPTIDPAVPVQALVGIGHGGAPAGRWARSGLWLPNWSAENGPAVQDRFLGAAELPHLPHAERMFMSCCVLGRIEDKLGEPLGLLALAFGYRTRVAIGSLVPVEDACATLLSLAFQWTVIERGPGADWVEAFHDLRCQLHTRVWPEGFGVWFKGLLEESLARECDPSALWVTGLAHLADMPPPGPRSATDEWWSDVRSTLATALVREVPTRVIHTADWFVALG